MSKRAGIQVVQGQIVGEDENDVGRFRLLLLVLGLLLPLGRREAGREGAGQGHPEEGVHGYKEYSLGLIHYLHVRIAGRCTGGAVRTFFSFTQERVFASFFEALDLPGLCFIQVKCYTFPRWASPTPEDRRSARSRRQPFALRGRRAGRYTRKGRRKQAPAERRLVSDLLYALTAAFLIGVLPGWFWTRCLLASGDRAEQLAYAVALSLTLVPTVALVQTYLFATGVTFGVTVVSVALVFLTGLATYLLSGPAKESEEPLSPPPSPPGFRRSRHSPRPSPWPS